MATAGCRSEVHRKRKLDVGGTGAAVGSSGSVVSGRGSPFI